MMSREDGEAIRADLVRDVPVPRNPIGSRDDEIHVALRHEGGGGRVRDHRVRDAELLELPRRQPAALEQRSRLVDPDVLDEARLGGGSDRADRRAVAARRKAARVAVREHAVRPRGKSSTAFAPMRRQRSTSSACIVSARSRVGSSRIASSAQRRLTAVGLEAASVSKASSTSSPRSAASAMPYAAATPIAGAPRTASTWMASAKAAEVGQRSSTSSSGNRRWSRRTTASASRRTIRSGVSS